MVFWGDWWGKNLTSPWKVANRRRNGLRLLHEQNSPFGAMRGSQARSQIYAFERQVALTQTTMSHTLPPEILDLIVDHLHDKPATLRACCLVSKSWVPRSRTHLFARVRFNTGAPPIESWIKDFPDPSTSPARYTQSLAIRGHQLFTDAAPVVGRQIRAFPFHNVVHLNMGSSEPSNDKVSLVPFHGLSPATRSLSVEFSYVRPSEVFGLMCSFPLLEDFTLLVFGYGNDVDAWTIPSTSPKLTGFLELRSVIGGIGPITRPLLDLPNGLNFTKLVLSFANDKDFESTTDLVSGCSNTLESLDVSDCRSGMFPSFLRFLRPTNT